MDLRHRGRPADGDGRSAATTPPSVVEPSLTEGEALDATTLQARRGDILGAGGEPLVTDRPVLRFGIDKTQVARGRRRRPRRAALAGWSTSTPRRTPKRVEAAGRQGVRRGDRAPRRTTPARGAAAATRTSRARVASRDTLPLAPDPRVRRADPRHASARRPPRSSRSPTAPTEPATRPGSPGCRRGTTSSCAARPGVTRRRRRRATARRASCSASTATPTASRCAPPSTRGLQRRPSRLLADVGPASALVAIRPSTGDVLAAASGPGSDGYNTATFGQYAPGSTFKVVTRLALLRAGLTPDDRCACPPTIVVDGKTFKNYDDYPAGGARRHPAAHGASPTRATPPSSPQRERLGDGDLADAAAALGLGVDHDLGFPAYFGQVPAAGVGDRAGRRD